MKQADSQYFQDIRFTNSVTAELEGMIGSDSFRNAAWFILTDENTHRHCLPLVENVFPAKTISIVVGAGELHKTPETCRHIWQQLLQHGADRHSVLVNLGGGMITDMGGFAAACFKRGIRFVNIPTSLLGMVDASVGGKTGVDLDSYKNMIGLFTYPHTVIIDKVFLKTLPVKEIRNGLVEVCKHALIADADYWGRLQEICLFDHSYSLPAMIEPAADDLIRKAIEIKSSIVARDPEERHERRFLNFGHTIGHALETYSLKHDSLPLSHGEAVSAGIICESFLSMKYSGLHPSECDEICKVMKAIFPVRKIHPGSFAELIHLMQADKKSQAGEVAFTLLSKTGNPEIVKGVSSELIFESFQFYNQ